jgi:S1-C subfamily serine protease
MTRAGRWLVVLALAGGLVAGADDPPRRASAKKRGDVVPESVLKGLYRPTLVLRKGNGRGSGTVIRSRAGETLVLTAAHVVRGEGDLQIELRPYNLGVEGNRRELAGTWPRLVPAEVIAIDPAADVALLRVPGMTRLPYVARFDLDALDPAPGEILTSIGIDGATELIGWSTDVRGVALLDLAALTGQGTKGDPRPFIVTTKPSVQGRSGGGLFRDDGSLVGICVGRIMADTGVTVGAFASFQSVRRLIRVNRLEPTLTRRPTRPTAAGGKR